MFEAGASGAALSKTVTVKILGDEVDEEDETFTLLLNNLRSEDSRVRFSSNDTKLQVKGTIVDDDSPGDAGHVVSAENVSVSEGDSGSKDMVFTVTLSGTPTHQVEFQAAAWAKPAGDEAKGGRGAGRDFLTFQRRKFVFEAGATGAALSKTVTVKILGDEVDEDDETFTLLLNNLRSSDSRVRFSSNDTKLTVKGTIIDDDSPGDTGHVVSATNVSVTEGDSGSKNMDFVVTLSATPSHQVEFQAAAWSKLAGDEAQGGRGVGRDFLTFQRRKFVFEAGATGAALSKTVTVTVLGDQVDEDDETFTLLLNNLRSEDHRVMFSSKDTKLTVKGTIIDDDDENDVGHVISVENVSVTEGDSGNTAMNFTVRLSGSPNARVELRVTAWGLAKGTKRAYIRNSSPGVPSATGGRNKPDHDFGNFANRALAFEAGATGAALSKTVTVIVKGDTTPEPDEKVVLELHDLTTTDHRVHFQGNTKRRATAAGTITNDD